MAQRRIEPGIPPIVWSTVNSAFDEINANFTELYLSLGNEDIVDLRNLASDLIPRSTEQYDLGAANKRWRDLYLSGSSLYLGDAVITSVDGKVNLPAGSTIGDLLIDEDYFKSISVTGQPTITADEGTDTLNISASTGISITTDALTDTITFSNTGIITAQSGTGISVSGTNPLIITNAGVVSLQGTAGQIGISSTGPGGTGTVTITNLGVTRLQTDPGSGIGLSANDGIIQISNTLPNIVQPVVRNIAVSGTPAQATLTSDNANYTVTFVPGSGTGITTNAGARTVTFTNAGVRSLTSTHPSIILSGSTGELTVGFNNEVDIIGSVFSDNSTMLVDSTNGVLRGTHIGNLIGDSDGIHTGSVYADNGTTLLVNGATASIPWSVLSDIPTEGKTIHVTTNGSNSNAGRTREKAYRTIKYALTQATAGDIVIVAAGTYEEEFPITVPTGVSIKGANLRSTIVKPTLSTNDADCFLLNGETTIEDLTIKDMFYNLSNNTGYAFRFASGCEITSRSPYIQRVTVLNKGPTVTSSDPYGYNSAGAGRGAYINGSQVTRGSLEAAMLFNECTFIVPNSQGIIITNGARVEWLNCFVYFAALGIDASVGSEGRGGDGKTYLALKEPSGTWAQGNTISYYDIDGVTLLASATIESISGSTYVLDGNVAGFVEADSRVAKIITKVGDANFSATQKNFGAGSLALDGTGDYLTIPSSEDFEYGTGDFTLECWVYRSDAARTEIIFDQRISQTDTAPVLFLSAGSLVYYTAGASRITGTGAVGSPNAWYHVAVSRRLGTTKLFVDGVQVGSSYTDNNSYIASPFKIGANYANTALFSGYIDEVRVTKGFSRYNSNFSSILNPFIGDRFTKLLIHFDSNVVDDSSTVYDIRSSAGGTATGLLRYDRKEFGAQLRSIASANIYGEQGVKGNGVGVILNLIAHNFAYIGTGADLTNNLSTVITENEVIEQSGAIVIYDSVDQYGNYKIGDLFTVDYRSGVVSFEAPSFNVTSLNGITFTDGTNTTTVRPTGVTIDNLVLTNNSIASTSGNIVVNPGGAGIFDLQTDTKITGKFTLIGSVPTSSKGVTGDLAGTIAADSTYFYYCTTDYTDGIADIWKRTAHGAGTW